nr:calphotin-like [Penaeus vannamei]
MKFIVLSLLAATCSAAPQLYQTVAGTVASPQWNLPAVMKIPEPGVNLGMVLSAPAPVPFVRAAPVPVPVVKAAPSLTVVEAAPVAVAPVVPLVKSAAIVAPAAPVAVAPVVKSAVPVTVVAAPEPLMAPEPPMPSLSVPHVGGQFHAQDEAGQYTFGHYGGPTPRGDQGLFGSYLRQLRLRGPRGTSRTDCGQHKDLQSWLTLTWEWFELGASNRV